MVGSKKPLRSYLELAIYSEKIEKGDYDRFFNNLIKRRVPFMGVFDLSDIMSLKGVSFVLKRYNNTIKIFIEDKDNMYAQSPLFFPFRMDQPKDLELMKSHLSLGTYFMFGGNIFDFLIKERIEELRIRMVKVFGGFYAVGNTVNKDGARGVIFISNPTKFFEIDLENNPVFYIELLDPIPKAVYVNSKEPIFVSDTSKIGVDNFSALQHSLIVGTSGVGKSKLLEILVKATMKNRPDVNILLIDPHNEFSKTFENAKVVDFVNNYVEPLDVGRDKSPLITQLVAQLITSTIAQESKYAERITFYSVHLLASIDELTLGNLNLLLTDSTKRTEFASRCDNDEVRRFFDEEFQDIYMHHFNDAILPVINFIGEYMLYIGKEKKLESVANLLENNRLTVVSFNPHFFGRKIIRFFAGAIINQMYMLAISEKLTRPTILVVDEFPVVESRVVKDILAETRKFNLFVYVSGQYLGQISKVVLDSIISNVRNIISFRVTREDAQILVSMMEIKVEEFFKKKVSPSELEESKKEMFLKLHPQECIVRLFDGTKYILPMKVKTVDVSVWGGVPSSHKIPIEEEEKKEGGAENMAIKDKVRRQMDDEKVADGTENNNPPSQDSKDYGSKPEGTDSDSKIGAGEEDEPHENEAPDEFDNFMQSSAQDTGMMGSEGIMKDNQAQMQESEKSNEGEEKKEENADATGAENSPAEEGPAAPKRKAAKPSASKGAKAAALAKTKAKKKAKKA